MKKLAFLLAALTFLFTSATSTFALTIDTIGASATTGGNPGTNWYYTSQNPTLTGTAGASTTVTVTIDGTPYTTTADASGNWSYTPTTLTTGDHTMVVTGDGASMSFTLHIGQSAPSGGSTGGTASGSGTLPVTGAVENTLLVLGLGGIMIAAGLKFKNVSV